jgi:hypothetical protein
MAAAAHRAAAPVRRARKRETPPPAVTHSVASTLPHFTEPDVVPAPHVAVESARAPEAAAVRETVAAPKREPAVTAAASAPQAAPETQADSATAQPEEAATKRKNPVLRVFGRIFGRRADKESVEKKQ